MTTSDLPCDAAYKHLSLLLATEKDQTIHQRVTAHVRAITGSNQPLPLFHANRSVTEHTKIEIYKTLIHAVATRDFSKLRGHPAADDKRVDPVDAAQNSVAQENAVSGEASSPVESVTPRVEVAGDDEISVLARILLKRIAPYLPKGPTVDAEAVKQISEEVFAARINNGGFPADKVKALIDEAMRGRVVVLNVTTPNGEVHTIDELYHWQLPQVVTWVNADVPLWLWGAAGGGKTHLNRQIAKALGPDYYTFSIDPTTTIGKVLGYRNLATGEFVQGWLYQPYKTGGVVMFDEIDTGDSGILASFNALLANDEYTFPNGERLKRHPKFRVIAGANTKGCGAVAGYTARNRLDAATLDRFAVVQLTYDTDLELALATGQPKAHHKEWQPGAAAETAVCAKWVSWVQKVRATVGDACLVSPRASILGAKALRAGLPAAEVAEATVFKLMREDTKQNIINTVGRFAV